MKQTLTVNCTEVCYYTIVFNIIFHLSYFSTSQRNASPLFTIQTAPRTCLGGTVYELFTEDGKLQTANTTCTTIIGH